MELLNGCQASEPRERADFLFFTMWQSQTLQVGGVESCFNPPNNEQLFMFILCFILYFLFDVAVGSCSS